MAGMDWTLSNDNAHFADVVSGAASNRSSRFRLGLCGGGKLRVGPADAAAVPPVDKFPMRGTPGLPRAAPLRSCSALSGVCNIDIAYTQSICWLILPAKLKTLFREAISPGSALPVDTEMKSA